ncbi:MAG: hypothetical protein J0M12_00355 [Deltaproteobacteria bacterium]|nr:hypothetical protein [Deltaproteobacteria bacterium]
MAADDTPIVSPKRGLSIANLAKMLFRSDASEDYIRSLPAQSLYLAVKHLGITSSADILESASLEQCRLMFDFDCWSKDNFLEENFWEWLSVADDEHGLRLLQKFIKFVDLKLVSLMISRHVDAKTFEEKTDNPPAPGFYTPDGGFTWVNVKIEESTRNFLFSRLLALIFETDGDLFYKLLQIPGVATESDLEEESYQAKSKRLQSEGFPSDDYAFELNSPLDEALLPKELSSRAKMPMSKDIPAIEPIIYDGVMVRPLADLISQAGSRDELESELSLIMNAAFVRWSVDLIDEERVRHWISKVRGAINLGLETAMKRSGKDALEIYNLIGLQKLYRLGLWKLHSLYLRASKISEDSIRALADDSAIFGIVAGARERFPETPNYVRSDGTIDAPGGELHSGFRAIEHLGELESIMRLLSDKVPAKETKSP